MSANREEVKLVVWPTEEPQIPPSPQRPARGWTAAAEETATEATDLPPELAADSTHAFLWQNPAEAAAVLRTVISRQESGGVDGPLAGVGPRQLVAAIMAGMGPKVGGAVLRHLTREGEDAYVAQAVAEEPQVTHAAAMAALELVHQRVKSGEFLVDGGPQLAFELLESAFGTNRARQLLRTDAEGRMSGFEWLNLVPVERVAPFISHEHPQTIAIILTQLKAGQAAGILGQLPERMQADAAYRMATMSSVKAAALVEIEISLEASLRDVMGGKEAVGGPKAVADMLNRTGSSTEKNVLDQMDGQDPKIAEAVRNLMFTFDDIAKLTDREMQTLMRECDQKDLAIAIKGGGDAVREKFLKNMEDEVRTFMTDEMAGLGPMRVSEAAEVQLRVVQQVRQLEEQGKVTIVRGDDNDDWI
ncbi:flagellar motor switch protein FliG [Candidatus Latescibacterota bacterium]